MDRKVKRSITSKIVTSYLSLIFFSLIFVGMFFSFSVRYFMETQATRNLIEDARSMVGIAERSISDSETLEGRIKEFREKASKRFGNLDSKWVLVNKDGKQLLNKTDEVTRFRTQIAAILKNKIEELDKKGEKSVDNRNFFRFELDDRVEYAAVIAPISVGVLGNVNTWLFLYTEIGPVEQMSRVMLVVLIISLVFTGVIAVIFGIIIARSFARPIILLKNRAERLSKRDFDTKVDINTGDELTDLAMSINKMAEALKDYDIGQKKFLQNASHELKTPLMSIQGYAEGIKDGVFEDNTKALDIIVDESKRLKSIVEELIFLSKLETMEDYYRLTSESVNDIIEKSVEKVRSIALKSNIQINTILYKDATIKLDGQKFIQALINILGNCLRYARNEINITTSNDEKYLEIIIHDDGEGFDPVEIKNIFERFYKGKKGNTGLGLAITKTIVEKHGGIIYAGNKPDGGAEFRVRLEIK